jgi:cytidylate kinase
MIVSITGLPGSGKTTVRNALAEQLGFKRYSMGDVFGKLALKHGLTIGEFNTFAIGKPEIDHEVDNYQTEIASKEDNFIIDGRLSWHFIPQSFKVFLDVDLTEAAKRIFAAIQTDRASRSDEPNYSSAAEVETAIRTRLAADNTRYQALYGVDYLNHSNYDLVIDTTKIPANEVVSTILAALPRP